MTHKGIVKVCGLREEANVREVMGVSPDMVGFIFHPSSPRSVCSSVPVSKEVTKDALRVGVFVDASVEVIEEASHKWKLQALQLHGRETPDRCGLLKERLNIKIFKAFPVGDELPALSHFEGVCDLYLFDTKGENAGGNGVSFDWSLLKAYTGKTDFLLSGGIGPKNIETLASVNHERCCGIDINSRVELSPGVKDIAAVTSVIASFREMGSGR